MRARRASLLLALPLTLGLVGCGEDDRDRGIEADTPPRSTTNDEPAGAPGDAADVDTSDRLYGPPAPDAGSWDETRTGPNTGTHRVTGTEGSPGTGRSEPEGGPTVPQRGQTQPGSGGGND